MCTTLPVATPRPGRSRAPRGGLSCPGLQPRAVAAERAPLRALVAYERVQRMACARGVLAARDTAHLVAGERHARGGRERLVRPGDRLQPLGRLKPGPPAVREGGCDRPRGGHAD